MQDSSFNRGRPRYCCSCGAFSPSPACAIQAVPAEHRAGAVLGTPRFLDDRIDAIPAARMARYLPDCTTFRIGLSRVGSETALRNRTHSFSSSVSRCALGTSMPRSSRRQREQLCCDAPIPRQVSPTVRPWLELTLASRKHPVDPLRFVCLSVRASLSSRVRIEAVTRNQGGSLSRIKLPPNSRFANGRKRGASFNARTLPLDSVMKMVAGTPRLYPQSHQ